jgi:hypothetical protein
MSFNHLLLINCLLFSDKQIDSSNLNVECFIKTTSGDKREGSELKCNNVQYSYITLNTIKTHNDLQVKDIIEIQTKLCSGNKFTVASN